MTTRYQSQNWFGKEGKGMLDPRNLNYLVQDLEIEGLSAETFVADALATAVLASARVNLEDDPRLGAVRRELIAVGAWHYRHPWEGNQGPTPRCTGFSGIKKWLGGSKRWSADKIKATLVRLGISINLGVDQNQLDLLANLLYEQAWRVDQREGRNFGTLHTCGCTMLALAKAGVELGLWKSYYWGYTLAEFIVAIQLDSVLMGMDWPEGCDDPDGKYGVIRYRGRVLGGHSTVFDGGDLDDGMAREDNTWGRANFGRRSDGYAYMPFEDIGKAFADGAEMLVTVE